MFRLILRNLAHTLRRYPLPSAINLAGLVVALTAFIIILSHVEFETSYDTSYPTSGRIFRVDCPGNDATFRSILPNAFARDVINSSTHIEAGSMLMPYLGEMAFYIEDEAGDIHGYELRADMVQPDFTKVFGMNILSGNPDALSIPRTAIIPQSMAEDIFRGDAVGKTMRLEESWFFPDGEITVGAVYEDFPANSQLHNSIYFATDERSTPYTYGGANFICYLLLDLPQRQPGHHLPAAGHRHPRADIGSDQFRQLLHLLSSGAYPQHQHPEGSRSPHPRPAVDADHGDRRHRRHRSGHLLLPGGLALRAGYPRHWSAHTCSAVCSPSTAPASL